MWGLSLSLYSRANQILEAPNELRLERVFKACGTVYRDDCREPVFSLSRRSFRRTASRPLQFLVLGDSVTWGQGLKRDQKFYTLVREWLKQQIAGTRRQRHRDGAFRSRHTAEFFLVNTSLGMDRLCRTVTFFRYGKRSYRISLQEQGDS
jgi:hypothetical protein